MLAPIKVNVKVAPTDKAKRAAAKAALEKTRAEYRRLVGAENRSSSAEARAYDELCNARSNPELAAWIAVLDTEDFELADVTSTVAIGSGSSKRVALMRAIERATAFGWF